MSRAFEQLDRRSTPMGEISVRRRLHPSLGIDIFEVILGDEHLMSSLFTVAEVALATLGLAALDPDATDLDVVVGGLGLGYTAGEVLADDRVRSLLVVEALDAVVEWHRAGILVESPPLAADPRNDFLVGDFFALVGADDGFGPQHPDRVHAILVDIDHSPHHHLHPSHAPFYTPSGLAQVVDRLHPGGVYALWSDDPPDADYVAVVESVFGNCAAHDVRFANPITGGEAGNTIYVATTPV